MTSLVRVRRARRVLLGAVAGAALLWAAAAAAALLVLAAVADLLVAVPFGVRRLVVPAAVAAGMTAAAVVLWRGRNARSLGRVALFIEERRPELQFALVSAVEPAGHPADDARLALERVVARVGPAGVLRHPVARALARPAAVLVIGLAALAVVPAGVRARILDPRPGDSLLRPAPAARGEAPIPSRLAPIVVRVEPPRYARMEPQILDDPETVAALVGSRIEVRGRGAALGLADSLGATVTAAADEAASGEALAQRTDGDTWSYSLVMPGAPAVLRLRDRGYDRLLVLEPVADSPPVVTLVSPPGDSTLPEPKGTIAVDARIQDDIGLARAELELLYSSGSGEQYETRQMILGRGTYDGQREARLRATIRLDTMNLRPGDVLHIRAVAWDENDVDGPGKGESETRTLRIQDPREVRDVNFTAARAAAIDTSIISQRMLIMRAETLLVEKPRLAQEDYTRRAIGLGVRQGELRGRVETIVHELENVEGVGFVGETPSSRILRQAAEEMRIAERELSIAQVPVALVHMRKALKYLEEVRDANRYWLRGLLMTTPVDLEQVRLTGRDPANVAAREARKRADDPRKALLARLNRAIELLEEDPGAARDSLQLLYAATLTQASDVSETLGAAIAALRRGDDAEAALVAARRRLERRVAGAGTLTDWIGTP